MKKPLIHCACVLGLGLGLLAAAFAKLPMPSPTPEAQAKAAEAAAKTAWSAKVDTFQLCQAQTRVADGYREQAAAAGRQVAPATPTPPCVDPGPFTAAAAAPTDAKPIEASGAHSPATTAASPPSSNQTSAETNPAPKK